MPPVPVRTHGDRVMHSLVPCAIPRNAGTALPPVLEDVLSHWQGFVLSPRPSYDATRPMLVGKIGRAGSLVAQLRYLHVSRKWRDGRQDVRQALHGRAA